MNSQTNRLLLAEARLTEAQDSFRSAMIRLRAAQEAVSAADEMCSEALREWLLVKEEEG